MTPPSTLVSRPAGVRIGLSLLGLYGFLVGLRPLQENDLFWHLTLGREVLRQGARSFAEPVGIGESATAWAPEWLFEVLASAMWTIAGELGISLFVALTCSGAAVLIGWLTWRMAEGEDDGSRAAWWLSACLGVAVASVRFKPRPETMGFLFLALLMVRAVDVARRPSLRGEASVCAIVLLWVQVHGLSVLALPILAAGLATTGFARVRRKVLLLAVVGALLLSGAYGTGVFSFVAEHLRSEALAHIVDMQRPAWDLFEPGKMVFGPFALLELALAALALALGRLRLTEGAWGLLGLGLLVTSARGMGPFAVLCAPAALRGAEAALAAAPRQRLALVLGVGILGAAGARHDALGGPLGRAGFAEGAVPVSVLSVLRRAPPGTVAITSYGAGAVIGFFLDGHVRVTLDSRTPLQFTALDYALARDAFLDPRAMEAYADSRGATAAVVERGRPECETLTRTLGFVPVAVDSRFAAFARPALGLAALETLDVCRPGLVSPRACSVSFAADLARLDAADPDFLDFLRATRELSCARVPPAEPMLRAWTSGELLSSMRLDTTLVAIDGYSQLGDVESAAALAAPLAGAGHAFAAQQLLKVVAKLPTPSRVRYLGQVCDARGDACAIEVRAALADACLESGDAACARFHGERVRLRRERGPAPNTPR